MFFYIAQIAMSAVVVLVSTTLVTFGKLVSPVVAAVFLVSLISSFIVTARLLYHTYEEAVQIWTLALATLFGLVIGWFAAPLVLSTYSLSEKRHDCFTNLESIRDSIELYRTQNGSLPPFLIGGTASGAPEQSSDPLIKSGVIVSYGINPYGMPDDFITWPIPPLSRFVFADKRPCYVGIDLIQELQTELGDPYAAGKSGLSRFGVGTNAPDLIIGNVLADPRFEATSFGYEAWGGGRIGSGGMPWIPGMFFYKAWKDASGDEHYVLGAYGSFYIEGYDILGPAPEGIRLGSDDAGNGCPLRIDDGGRIIVGNPDGIKDGVIYVLTDKGEWTPEGITQHERGWYESKGKPVTDGDAGDEVAPAMGDDEESKPPSDQEWEDSPLLN